MTRYAVPCQGCPNHGDYCQYCREITKKELAAYLRDEIPIYLSERNRANRSKNITRQDLERVSGLSCRKAGKYLGVSAQTVSRARRDAKRGLL